MDMTQGESKGEEQRGQKKLLAQRQSRSWMSERVRKNLKKSNWLLHVISETKPLVAADNEAQLVHQDISTTKIVVCV